MPLGKKKFVLEQLLDVSKIASVSIAAPAIVLHPFPLPPTIHLSSGPLQFACRCVCVHVHDNNNSVINLPEHVCVCVRVCVRAFIQQQAV